MFQINNSCKKYLINIYNITSTDLFIAKFIIFDGKFTYFANQVFEQLFSISFVATVGSPNIPDFVCSRAHVDQ